jgi:predicted transposase/invertase (TIGR01784 family)
VELLDPKLDIDHRLLRSMIEAILRLPAPIEELVVLNPEIPPSLAADKAIELDIRIRLTNQRRIDLEMQSRVRAFMAERFLYYWAREYASLLSRGDQYVELVPVCSIIWFNDTLLRSNKFHSVFHVSEDTTREVFSPHLELHTLELPKLSFLAPEDDPVLHRWSRFLTAHSPADLAQLALEDPIMSLAKTALEHVSEDPKVQSLAREREESLRLYEYTLARMATESRAEGRNEGRNEGLGAGLLLLLQGRFGALPSWVEERVSVGSSSKLTSWFQAAIDAKSLEEVFQTDS